VDHLAVADIDADVADAQAACTEEDKVSGLEVGESNGAAHRCLCGGGAGKNPADGGAINVLYEAGAVESGAGCSAKPVARASVGEGGALKFSAPARILSGRRRGRCRALSTCRGTAVVNETGGRRGRLLGLRG
jgi:hypothetical protein